MSELTPVPISFKSKEVNAADVHPLIFHAIAQAGFVWGAVGAQELIVTSLKDGSHRKGSRHRQEICTAVDLRTHNLPGEAAREEARRLLRDLLGGNFVVLYEYPETQNAHMHVSYVGDGKPA